MKIDGIDLVEGSSIVNLVVSKGPTFPTGPTAPEDVGELFYLTVADTTHPIGLHYYDGSKWQLMVSSGNIQGLPGTTNSTVTLTSTLNANQVLFVVNSTMFRTLKVLVQASSGTSYHSSETFVIHDGTNCFIDEYGSVMSGPSLFSLDADLVGGNIRLLATPTYAVTKITTIYTAISN